MSEDSGPPRSDMASGKARLRLFSLPRTVLILGGVSLLNDMASEMIAPLLPIFLTATLGAGPAVVGLIEGFAEAASSLLKLLSGRLADLGWDTKKLVLSGYTVSNAARPLIGLAGGWAAVLGLRLLDRVGKGLRTAPRDALIAGAVDAGVRGRAFGFHRAMDHAGAMLGPVVAFFLLQAAIPLRDVFLLSVVFGVLLLLLLGLGLKPTPPRAPAAPPAPLSWHGLDYRVRGLLVGAGTLALATTPEVFLVLWARAGGITVAWVPLLWAAAHALKAIVAAPAGDLSDRLGRVPVVLAGWAARVCLLILLAETPETEHAIWALFLGYAGALAFTEGAERAVIGDLAPSGQKATAFGLYHLITGILALPGAFLFGLFWQWLGMKAAFLIAAGLTAGASLLMLLLITRDGRRS